MTQTFTKSNTFTITHARHLASKVAADMHLCAHYYGNPPEDWVRSYSEELAQYLNEGYLEEYEFGYARGGIRVVTWRYKVDTNGAITTDDRAGKVVPYVDVAGASFFNFLTQNSRFSLLSAEQRRKFKESLPVARGGGSPPSDGNGCWTSDRNYCSGGQGLGRRTFQVAS